MYSWLIVRGEEFDSIDIEIIYSSHIMMPSDSKNDTEYGTSADQMINICFSFLLSNQIILAIMMMVKGIGELYQDQNLETNVFHGIIKFSIRRLIILS